LADAALELFLERGYDAVGVREIADTADVSVATLFKHFPDGKEALVFDQDADRETALVTAVRERPTGQSIPQVLRQLLRDEGSRQVRSDPRFADFLRLIDTTPALLEHSRRMWLRHAARGAQHNRHVLYREHPTTTARTQISRPDAQKYRETPA
jgi:AcrR family transcriptional regulator